MPLDFAIKPPPQGRRNRTSVGLSAGLLRATALTGLVLAGLVEFAGD